MTANSRELARLRNRTTRVVGQDAIRTPGGKWHRGGRYDYPGQRHCPTGLGLVLMPRGCESAWADQVAIADMCRRCFDENGMP